MTYYSTPPRSDELYHYGIKGMRWGVRRYENKDGTLTPLGKRRYTAYNTYEKYEAKRLIEADKLLNQNAKLKKKWIKAEYVNNPDDHDTYFQDDARKLGLDPSKYINAERQSEHYHARNYNDIHKGQKYLAIKNMTDDQYKKYRKNIRKSRLKTAAAASGAALFLSRKKIKNAAINRLRKKGWNV